MNVSEAKQKRYRVMAEFYRKMAEMHEKMRRSDFDDEDTQREMADELMEFVERRSSDEIVGIATDLILLMELLDAEARERGFKL